MITGCPYKVIANSIGSFYSRALLILLCICDSLSCTGLGQKPLVSHMALWGNAVAEANLVDALVSSAIKFCFVTNALFLYIPVNSNNI